MMQDWSSRFSAAERRLINKLRVRILLVYVVLIAAIVAFAAIRGMWSGTDETMEARSKDNGIYATAGAPSARLKRH